MTYLVAPGSRKSDRAVRFGQELQRAMVARGISSHVLAETLGSSRTSVMYWRTGKVLPRLDTAERLAEALRASRLVTLMAELRTKSCLVDGVAFVDDTGSDNRVYCSTICQNVRDKSRLGTDVRARAGRAENRLAAIQLVVAAFCDRCEPGGRCFTPECELRPASPLPLAARDTLEPARPKPHNGYRAPGADSARMERVWAGYTPAQRRARAAAAAHARYGER